MAKQCPICEKKYINYMGDGDILFLGSTPTEDELAYMKPFAGRNIQMWKSHLLQYANLDLHSCRYGLLNAHITKNEDCTNFNQYMAMKEIAEVQRVILVGADVCKWMTGYSINQVNGMDVSELIDYHDVGNVRFFAMVTPVTVYATQGEYYYAMKKLGEWLNDSRI